LKGPFLFHISCHPEQAWCSVKSVTNILIRGRGTKRLFATNARERILVPYPKLHFMSSRTKWRLYV